MKLVGFVCVFLLNFTPVQAVDYCETIRPMTRSLIEALQIPSNKPFSLSTRSQDDRYLLKLDEFWSVLSKCARSEHNKDFKINVIDGALGQIAMNFYLEANKAGHDDLDIGTSKLDSLIIGAEVVLNRQPFELNIKLRVTDLNAKNIYTSSYFDLTKLKGHPGLKVDIFNKLRHPEDIDKVIYNRKVIDAVNDNLFNPGSIFSTPDNVFNLKHDWSYGNPDELRAIQSILQKVYGFKISKSSKNTIRLTADGALVFTKAGEEITIPNMVTKMDMVGDGLEEIDGFYTETVAATVSDGQITKPAVYQKIPFKSIEPVIPIKKNKLNLSEQIKYAIEDKLAGAYGRMGGPPNYAFLQKVFQGRDKCILRGTVVKSDPVSGIEKVAYYWDTPKSYISGLRKKVNKRNRHFDVDLKIMKVYQDRGNMSRYWSVVRQKWITRDYKGDVVYKDDGFLFINFDFDELGNLGNLKIFYRLWFYNYKYDDKEKKRKRWQLIENDIKGAFNRLETSDILFGKKVNNKFVRDNSERGLSGIDSGLISQMRTDLINEIKRDHP